MYGIQKDGLQPGFRRFCTLEFPGSQPQCQIHDKAKRARFTTITKNNLDAWFRQVYPVKFGDYLTGAAFNVFRGMKILPKAVGKMQRSRPV